MLKSKILACSVAALLTAPTICVMGGVSWAEECPYCPEHRCKGQDHAQIQQYDGCLYCDHCLNKLYSNDKESTMDTWNKESTIDSETAPSTGLVDNVLLASGLAITSGMIVIIKRKFAK